MEKIYFVIFTTFLMKVTSSKLLLEDARKIIKNTPPLLLTDIINLQSLEDISSGFEELDLEPLDDPDFSSNEVEYDESQSEVSSSRGRKTISSNKNGINKTTTINKNGNISQDVVDRSKGITKSIFIRYDGRVTKEIEDERNKIRKSLLIREDGRVVQTIDDKKNGKKQEFIKREDGRVIKTTDDEKNDIWSEFIKREDDRITKTIDDKKNGIKKSLVKREDGRITKIIQDENKGVTNEFIIKEDGGITRTIAYKKEGITKELVIRDDGRIIKTIEDEKKGIKETLVKRENSKIIMKTIKDSRKGTTEITFLDEDGKLSETMGDDKDGPFEISLSNRPDIHYNNIQIDGFNFNSGLINFNVDSGLLNNKSASRKYGRNYTSTFINGNIINLEELINASKKFLNKGIIVDEDNISAYGYQECSRTTDLSSFSKVEFEDISDSDGNINDPKNAGYLVHYSRDGRKWRTKNKEFIDNVLDGDSTAIDDCGYTEYNSEDGKMLWSKNEGIIENGKFVISSANLISSDNFYKYVIGKTSMMWGKSKTNNSAPGSTVSKNAVVTTANSSTPPRRSTPRRLKSGTRRKRTQSRKLEGLDVDVPTSENDVIAN